MYVNWEDIRNAVNCTETMARKILRKYKRKWKEELNFNLVDNKTIPTWYFISCYSKEYGISQKELCQILGYDDKKLKSHIATLEREEIK